MFTNAVRLFTSSTKPSLSAGGAGLIRGFDCTLGEDALCPVPGFSS